MLFSLKKITYNKGHFLLKPGDPINDLVIVFNGVLEVFIVLEDEEFVIERLKQGTILNHRSFFAEECSKVYIRCEDMTTILSLSLQQLESMVDPSADHTELRDAYLAFEK